MPLLILLGLADRWISAAPGVAATFAGDGGKSSPIGPPNVAAQIGLAVP